MHKHETKIKGLELGSYLLVASADSIFNVETATVAFSDFQISNIAYFSRKNTGNQLEVYLRDRTKGNAINKGKLQLVNPTYDKENRNYLWENIAAFTADKNGYLLIDTTERGRQSFYITNGKDSLMTNYF